MSFDYCHLCGADLVELENEIYVCEFCGNKLDLSVFENVEKEGEENEDE